MGRHRRSARATADEAAANARKVRAPLTSGPTGVFVPEDPAEAVTQPLPVVRSGPTGAGRHRSPHRGGRKKAARSGAGMAGLAGKAGKAAGKTAKGAKAAPARRTGLLGASAAVAMGAVAMVSGLLPHGVFSGGEVGQPPGAGTSGQVRADGPPEVPLQGAPPAAPAPTDRSAGARRTAREAGAEQVEPVSFRQGADAHADRGAERPAAPAAQAAAPAAPAGQRTAADEHPGAPAPRPSAAADEARPSKPGADAADEARALRATLADPRSAAAHLVLSLVNAERAKAGCRPLVASGKLDKLAQSFSDDMAQRGFFDHTDPEGRTPWDRAAKRGIKNLGGENIARGHADAHTVMEAWMRSSGHRANILNCDYRSLGVGVHHGGSGPYWTQDFGY